MNINQLTFETNARALIKDRVKRQAIVKKFQVDQTGKELYPIFTKNNFHGLVLITIGKCMYATLFSILRLNEDRNGRLKPVICDFCFTYMNGASAARVSFVRKSDKHSFSWICCANLYYSSNARMKTKVAKESQLHLREDLSITERCRRLSAHLKVVTEVLALEIAGNDD